MNIVQKLLTLPPFVEFEGAHFKPEIFFNGDTMRLAYSIYYVEKNLTIISVIKR
jgi:hypothetical protein